MSIRTNKTLNDETKKDSLALKKYLIDKLAYKPEYDDKILDTYKYIHKSIYNFSLLKYYFNDDEPHRMVFMDEINTILLESLQLALLGFKKSTHLCLRCTIESLLKHIYFYDHKVEFMRSEIEDSYYILISNLWSYIKNHPELNGIKYTVLIPRLENYYEICSRYIHSQNRGHMNLIESIEDIAFDSDFFISYVEDTANIIKIIISILIIFYSNKKQLDLLIKTHLLDFLPQEYRNFINI